MKRLTLLFLLFSQISFAQSNLAKEVIQEIEFQTDSIESVFKWIADNIRYDATKANHIEKAQTSERRSDHKSEELRAQKMLKDVLRKKKGVCEDYSILFNALVKELGYESFIIHGYTKKNNGILSRRVGHTWNAVKVNNKWMLYDPTWGAGSLNEKKRFVKKYSPIWYETIPSEMIKTHMPYDPIWQLQEPISYKDFEENTEFLVSDKSYNPEEAIADFFSKNEKDQLKSQLDRSVAQGKGVTSLTVWRKHIEERIEHLNHNNKVDVLKVANDKCKHATELFNKFVDAQNSNFKGEDHDLLLIKKNLEQAELEVNDALKTFNSINIKAPKNRRMLKKTSTSAQGLLTNIKLALTIVKKREDAESR